MLTPVIGPVPSVISISILFALCHPRHKLIWSGLMGLVSSILYAATGSLIPGLIAHITVNLSDMAHFYLTFYIHSKKTSVQ